MGAPGCPTPTKRGYKSRDGAKRHMWSLLKARKSTRRDWQALGIYKCECGLFHVGHRGHVGHQGGIQ